MARFGRPRSSRSGADTPLFAVFGARNAKEERSLHDAHGRLARARAQVYFGGRQAERVPADAVRLQQLRAAARALALGVTALARAGAQDGHVREGPRPSAPQHVEVRGGRADDGCPSPAHAHRDRHRHGARSRGRAASPSVARLARVAQDSFALALSSLSAARRRRSGRMRSSNER